MIRRTVVAAVALGLAALMAAPAQADPRQVCLVYDEERNGICVEIGDLR